MSKELNINKKNILSVILAGGLSKRFGGNIKTFAKINGISIYDRIMNLLKNQGTEIVINTNFEEEIFLKSQLPIIKDKNNNFQGPLSGIYSTMSWIKEKKFKFEWILSVPSDTPFLPKNLLDTFISKINNDKKIFIARSRDKVHPVIGIWNISLFDNLKAELLSDNRKIMKWVVKNDYEYVDFPTKEYDPFFNINKKEDITEAKLIEKIIGQSSEKL